MVHRPPHTARARAAAVCAAALATAVAAPLLSPPTSASLSPPSNMFVEWAPDARYDGAALDGAPPAPPPAAVAQRYLLLVGPIGPSHSYVLRRVGLELAARGARVLAVAPAHVEVAPPTDAVTAARWEAVTYDGGDAMARLAAELGRSIWREAHLSLVMGPLTRAAGAVCDALVADAATARAVAAFGPTFVVGDLVDPCGGIMSERLGLPRAEVSVGSLVHGLLTSPARAVPRRDWPLAADLSSTPGTGVPLVPPLTSPVAMLRNAVAYGVEAVLDIVAVRPQLAALHARHGVDLSTPAARARNALVVVNSDPAWEHARALPPGVVLAGSILAGPGQALPADLAAWLAAATARSDRVVYYSMGTVFSQPPGAAAAIVAGLASAETRVAVLARATERELDARAAASLPPSVRVVRWAPQNDLLASGGVSLFVTHGGASSIGEAVFHGVPLVVAPQGAEQLDNAVKVAAAGFGVPVLESKPPPDAILAAATRALSELPVLAARARAVQARARVGRPPGAVVAAAAIERAALLGLGARTPLPQELSAAAWWKGGVAAAAASMAGLAALGPRQSRRR